MLYNLNLYELSERDFFNHFGVMPVQNVVIDSAKAASFPLPPGFAYAVIWQDNGAINVQLGYSNIEGVPVWGHARAIRLEDWGHWDPWVPVRLDSEDKECLHRMMGFHEAIYEEHFRKQEEEARARWEAEQKLQEARDRTLREKGKELGDLFERRRKRAVEKARRAMLPPARAPGMLPAGPNLRDENYITWMFYCLSQQRLPDGRRICGGWRETMQIPL